MFEITDKTGKVILRSSSEALTNGLLGSLNRRSESGVKNSARWYAELSKQMTLHKLDPAKHNLVLTEEGYKIEIAVSTCELIMTSPVQFTRLVTKEVTGGKRGRKPKEIEIEVVNPVVPAKRGRKPKESAS